MNFRPIMFMVACTSFLLAGCASGKVALQSTPYVTVLDTHQLPPPAEVIGTLGPLDTVRIDVFGVEELTREVQVDSSGRLSFPFVGSLEVAGKRPSEVEARIASRLGNSYVLDPKVTVNLIKTVSQTVAIEGEVATPGLYPAAGDLSLLRALALAGGPTKFAQREQVIVFREVGDDRYAAVYNLDAVRAGTVEDPRIYAKDTIVLGDSPRRRAIDQIVAIAPALASPLVLLFTR